MDKDHASSIAISKILDKLQIKPEYTGKSKSLYRSPICKVQEPSFWVYFDKNSWHDYAISVGGNLDEFVQRYLKFTGEDYAPSDVRRWIFNMSDSRFHYSHIPYVFSPDGDKKPTLIIKTVEQIRLLGLIRYLEREGISLPIAQKYMKELKVLNRNTSRTFLALGIKNENDGYELLNPFFSGFVKSRGITIFRGVASPSRSIHVFKHIFDFLSVLMYLGRDRWEHDSLVLHTNSNAQLAAPYIQSYEYKTMHSWMDNDLVGHRATGVLNSLVKDQSNLVHLKMNRVYNDFDSVSAWYRHKNSPAL